MKIALVQQNYHIGNFLSNFEKMKQAYTEAVSKGAELLVFPELAVCGYPPRDFLEFDDFLQQSQQSLHKLAALAQEAGIITGAPVKNDDPSGKPLFNSACLLYQGKILNVRHKSLLPNYDVFDEYRYFEPGLDFHLTHFKGLKIALTICEDLWNIGDEKLYRINPMDDLALQEPDIIINIAASPFHYKQPEKRKNILEENAKKYALPVIYVNHVGAQTELLFDGGSMALNKEGELCWQLKRFQEDLVMVDTAALKPMRILPSPSKMELIHDALVMGIRDYFEKLSFTKAILGLSGGIDSAVTLALAVRALGKENVLSLLMPSPFSTGHSVDDSLEMLNFTGSPHHIISISDAYAAMNTLLLPYFKDLPFGLAEENIQARLRALLLMAFSNKFGYILLNTSNKSEAAVGYGTLYGDMCGGISVLGDLYKTEVYELAHYINSHEKLIPENIISKAPSAELRPDQKDSDSLPEYDVLDKILYQYIELRLGPAEIIAAGFPAETVRKTLALVNQSEHKRHQAPPMLRVSEKAFGSGRRLPIVGKYLQ